MACIAGITLVQRGTVLDRVWVGSQPTCLPRTRAIRRNRWHSVFAIGRGFGCFRPGLKRQRWAWQLAAFIIAIQVFGDFVNVVRGHAVQGGGGMAIAGARLFYMLRPKMRAVFFCI
jgi:hypothetical protein